MRENIYYLKEKKEIFEFNYKTFFSQISLFLFFYFFKPTLNDLFKTGGTHKSSQFIYLFVDVLPYLPLPQKKALFFVLIKMNPSNVKL